MENTNFRIGNYLLDRENRLCRVEELSCREGEREVYAPAIIGGMTGLPNKPIPLTEEWLLKLGFEKKDDYLQEEVYECNTPIHTFQLTNEEDNGWFMGNEETYLEIKYVHQLQNLYFALTGEDLNTQY